MQEETRKRHRAVPGRPGPALIFATVALLLAGCSTLCPAGRSVVGARTGEVHQDYPACRWLEVVDQRVERGPADRLRVTVKWRNLDDEPYPVRMRAVFFTAPGLPEEEGGEWSTYALQPGAGNVVKFFSSSAEATRYRIEVESQSSLPW